MEPRKKIVRESRIAQHPNPMAEMLDTMSQSPLYARFSRAAVSIAGLIPLGSAACLVDNPRFEDAEPEVDTDTDEAGECTVDGDCLGTEICEFGACVEPLAEPGCGDGHVDPGESCDLGESNGDQGECKSDCTTQACGDGFVGPDEECDDGNDADDDGCTQVCTAAVCGDGSTRTGVEECDDGNVVDDDACRTDCRLTVSATCGDRAHQPGEFCFDDPIVLSTTQIPVGLTVGDFNDDGIDDIAVAIRVITGVKVFVSDGLGGFAAQNSVGFNDGYVAGGVGVAKAVVSVDYDSDGRADVMGGTVKGSTSFLSWLDRSNGEEPMFQPLPQVKELADHVLLDLALADGDGDGLRNDVLALTRNGDETRLWRRMRQITFDVVTSTILPGDYTELASALVDGDLQNPRVVVLEPADDHVALYDVDGVFLGVLVSPDPHGVVVGDLDGDGFEDFVVGEWDPQVCPVDAVQGSCAEGMVHVFSGSSELDEVHEVASAPVGKAPQALALGDFDNSGHTDIASLDAVSGTITVVEGDDEGVYGYARKLEIGITGEGSLQAGDFNDDGIDDLAVTHEGSETLRVFLSNP